MEGTRNHLHLTGTIYCDDDDDDDDDGERYDYNAGEYMISYDDYGRERYVKYDDDDDDDERYDGSDDVDSDNND